MATSALPRPRFFAHLRLAAKVSDLAWTLEHLHRRYGPVVDVGYRIPIRITYVFGPEANQHLLADDPDNFTWREAMRLLEVVDGLRALLLSDGDEHRRRRRLVQPAFSIRRVEAHLDLVVSEIDRLLDGWRPGRSLEAHAELRAAVRRIVVRALFGQQLGTLADEIGERLEPALRYVARTPLSRVDVDLRWNAYGRAKEATRAVDGVVRETLRLWPPGVVGGRTAVDDFELLGHRIPGGSTILYSPYVTHRLPEVWGDPERFRPERWADGEPVPYSFVPFGGGYRRCIGFALATLELQVLAVRLAQRVDWTLDRPDAKGAGVATFAPKGGVPITVH